MKEKKQKKESKLVKMKRDGKSADVHSKEVKNMESHGWFKA